MSFPPKNRPQHTELGPIDIEIANRLLIDPNRAVMSAANGELEHFLTEQEPIGPSDISGEPGFSYRTSQVQLTLTSDEMLRLCLRALLPHEVRTLLEKFGDFHEVHDDFYCHGSFTAL